MNRSLLRITFALGATALAQSLAGCAGQGDIDRTQPDKIDKSMFFQADGKTSKIFYYRQTYVERAADQRLGVRGHDGEPGQDPLRDPAEVPLGYRAYDYVPGSQNPLHERRQQHRHAAGGVQASRRTSTSSASTTPAPASRPTSSARTPPIAPGTSASSCASTGRRTWSTSSPPGMSTSGLLHADDAHADQRLRQRERQRPDPRSPDLTPTTSTSRSRRSARPTSTPASQLFDPGIDDGGRGTAAPAQLKVRHSFLAVKPSTYEPLDYPDRQPLLDDNGKPIRLPNGVVPCTTQVQLAAGQYSGADCSPAGDGRVREVRLLPHGAPDVRPATTARPSTGRQVLREPLEHLADKTARRSADSACSCARTVSDDGRAIVYYTNVEFPDDPDLLTTAQEVVGSWNDAMKQTVVVAEPHAAAARAASHADERAAGGRRDCPTSSCSRRTRATSQGVKDLAGKHQDVADAVENATGDQRRQPRQDGNLRTTCAALEAWRRRTWPTATPRSSPGSATATSATRSSTGSIDPQPTGPLGYGPSSADPETGEIISAVALHLRRGAEHLRAVRGRHRRAAQRPDLDRRPAVGQDHRRRPASRPPRRAPARDALPLTPEAKAMATAMLSRAAGGQGRLVPMPVPGGQPTTKIDAHQGHRRREADDDAGHPRRVRCLRAESGDRTTSSRRPDRRPARRPPTGCPASARKAARASRFQTLATTPTAACTWSEFADDAIMGTRARLNGQACPRTRSTSSCASRSSAASPSTRWATPWACATTSRARATRSTTSTSTGTSAPACPQDQWADQPACSEYQYSTVMDYGARFNTDVHGLGKYDYAAIRFGYGQLVDMIAQRRRRVGVSSQRRHLLRRLHQHPRRWSAASRTSTTMATCVVRYRSLSDVTRAGYLDPSSPGRHPRHARAAVQVLLRRVHRQPRLQALGRRRQPGGDRQQHDRSVQELLLLQRVQARTASPGTSTTT